MYFQVNCFLKNNYYRNIIQALKSLYDIMVIIVFFKFFCLKIHQNNIYFLFLNFF